MWKYVLFFSLLFLYSCKKDSCTEKICLNGGTCVNGDCDCPERWTGDDCSVQVTPRFIHVRNLHLDSIPQTNLLGEPWDPGGINDGPDLTFRVTLNGADEVYTHNLFLSNVDPLVAYDFPITESFIMDPLEYYIFEFLDHDFSEGNTVIGTGRTVPIGVFNTDFPDTIYAEIGDLNFSLLVEYEW